MMGHLFGEDSIEKNWQMTLACDAGYDGRLLQVSIELPRLFSQSLGIWIMNDKIGL